MGLAFSYEWSNCEPFGFVRTARLTELTNQEPVEVEMVDGLLNILPSGILLPLEESVSCLVNSHTYCEVDAETQLGIFSTPSPISDRTEPLEALRATVIWCHGLDSFKVLLSTDQLKAFRASNFVQGEKLLTGKRGAYLTVSKLALEPGETTQWDIVADVNVGHVELAELKAMLLAGDNVGEKLRTKIGASTACLRQNIASADGLMTTSNKKVSWHHFANVLFNNMRGGVFDDNNKISVRDLARFISQRNKQTFKAHNDFLASLGEKINVKELLHKAEKCEDPNLERLCYEYLPITFSRRHGDPSRPWNKFSICVRNEDGSRSLGYEGNWRDIFQNWESLCLSFPCFLENVIAKFVNASTIDGFNPCFFISGRSRLGGT